MAAATNNLSSGSYPTLAEVSKLTRSAQGGGGVGMGTTDVFTCVVSVVIIFVVGVSTGFWWQMSRKKMQEDLLLLPHHHPHDHHPHPHHHHHHPHEQQQKVLKDSNAAAVAAAELGCSPGTPKEQQLLQQEVGFLKKYKLEEIHSMTNFFKVVLGEGSQGTVYEASLPGPEPRQKAAVKKLDRNKALDHHPHHPHHHQDGADDQEEVFFNKDRDSSEKEFWSELLSISRLHHSSIVALLGYCCADGDSQLFLIYEFMEMGSLKQHLHSRKKNNNNNNNNNGGGGETVAATAAAAAMGGHHHHQHHQHQHQHQHHQHQHQHVLDWNQRMRVAMDVAQGLEYLHNHAKPALVHRDIKPSNILLDAEMHAKIADFGLSKSIVSLDLTTTSSVHIRGTPGYVDPAYYRTGQANEKNDVYSYGVVLLELVTGKRAIDERNNMSLVLWCRDLFVSLHAGDPVPDMQQLAFRLPKMVDDQIHLTEYMPQQLLEVVQLAMHCVEDEPTQRPNMKEVSKRLYVIVADHEEAAASSSESSTEDSLTNNGLLNHPDGSPRTPKAYSRAISSNGWSTYEITETSIIIKYTVKNKKIAIRCKIWPTLKNLGMNKIEATLDDALMWKKSLWIYNACSSREFSVDEVQFRAEWQVGLRFSRHLLKAGDPRRNQGPFCVEYLALKNEDGMPLIEYHSDRSPFVTPPHREPSLEPLVTTIPLQRRKSSLMRETSFPKKSRKSLATTTLAPR